MQPKHLDLSIGARARLATLRAASPADWRAARKYGLGAWARAAGELSHGHNGNVPVWYAHTGPQFRGEQFADECRDAPRHVRGNRGWYVDDGCSDVMRGMVARLPHGRFMVAYYSSGNGERVYLPEVHDCERDAAISADEEARVVAEHEREYHARWCAAEDLRDTIENDCARVRECLAMRHKISYARAEILELCAGIRAARAELASDRSPIL